jgi:hypothetical protein
MLYFVVHQNTVLGPWTLEEIAGRMHVGEFRATDFIYNETSDDWTALMDYEPLKALLRQTAPTPARPKFDFSKVQTLIDQTGVETAQTWLADPAQWVAMSSSGAELPDLSTGAVIRHLQCKELVPSDLIRKTGSSSSVWQRIAEHDEFKNEAVRRLLQSGQHQGLFVQRRFPRIDFETRVLIHDRRTLWQGESFQGGEGGSGLIVRNAGLQPGQSVLVHFMSGKAPAFNAECEIVSKQFDSEIKSPKQAVKYGVRFLRLDSRAKDKITDFFRTEGGQ